MESEAPILIVGAGQAGVQIAESLRQEGYAGPLTLIGEEPHPPYHRPPLSKKWLLEPSPAGSLAIRGVEALARRRIDLRLGVPVRHIDRARARLQLDDGSSLPYRALALATGARPRSLALAGAQLAGVLMLRTVDDAGAIGAALRTCASQRRPVVVIGGGFIGLEVAAAAARLGARATVLESLPRLLARVSAPIVSEAFLRLHRAHGVRVLCEAQVCELLGSEGHVAAVRTADGEQHPAGCVIVGVGVQPDERLAAAAGLACERGVIVDECARTSDPRIAAAGDCTARRLPDGGLLRLESVHNAVEQGKCAAAALMGRERPFRGTPWFWSDQYDVKLQMAGLSHGYDELVTRGDVLRPAFSAWYFRGGRLIAADTLNRIQDHMTARRLLDQDILPTPAQVADERFDLQALSRSARAGAALTEGSA